MEADVSDRVDDNISREQRFLLARRIRGDLSLPIIIFALAGFSMMLYQLVQSRYIELLLGVQARETMAFVALLAMALGAGYGGRLLARVSTPLVICALTQVVVALLALYFHNLYLLVQAWVSGWVWQAAMIMIALQAFLFGVGFVMLAGGLMRSLTYRAPHRLTAITFCAYLAGVAIAPAALVWLLIPWFGLSGTMTVAGVAMTVVAVFAWLRNRQDLHRNEAGGPLPPRLEAIGLSPTPSSVLLTLTLLAGMLAAVYLTVVGRVLLPWLGSYTDTPIVVLSAFMAVVAIATIIKGVVSLFLALAMLLVFVDWFWLYKFLWHVTTAEGYEWQNLFRWFAALSVGLPAAWGLGACVPLLAQRYLDSTGEAATSWVHAALLGGAALGWLITCEWLLSTHWGWVLVLALLLAMGVVVATVICIVGNKRAVLFTAMLAVVAVITGNVNLRALASSPLLAEEGSVIYEQHNTNSHVVVEEHRPSDAAPSRLMRVNSLVATDVHTGGQGYAEDELIAVMQGLLPLMFHPEAEVAMVIDEASGLSTRTLLHSPRLRRIETVDLDAGIAAARSHLGARVETIFSDPRSRFIAEDARYVLRQADKNSYDIITAGATSFLMEEAARLFTQQFYRLVRSALTERGIFVQRLPLYGNSPTMSSAIIRAVAAEFADFKLFIASNETLIIVASARPLPPMSMLNHTPLREFLSTYDLRTKGDIAVLEMGDKSLWLPYFLSFEAPVNSDYNVFVEVESPYAQFSRWLYVLADIPRLPIPILESVGQADYSNLGEVSASAYTSIRNQARLMQSIYRSLDDKEGAVQSYLTQMALIPCPEEGTREADSTYMQSLTGFFIFWLPFASKDKMAALWQRLETDACIAELLLAERQGAPGLYVKFWQALSLRDSGNVLVHADALLSFADPDSTLGRLVTLAAVASAYEAGSNELVLRAFQTLSTQSPAEFLHAARLLATQAEGALEQ